jgi:hypothetical protein
VSFKDGVTTLGTTSLVGGTATFTTTTLGTGGHTITATYNSDTEYNAAKSAGNVAHTVNAATTSTALLRIVGNSPAAPESALATPKSITFTTGTVS